MKVTASALDGVLLIEPDVHRDDRGFFLESWHQERYAAAGIVEAWVQDNHSSSVRGTVRGLHAQATHPQSKLVRAIEGLVWDVAVDIRVGSPGFGRWLGVELSAENHRQIYIPSGYAHGFCVLSDRAQIEYKCSDFYDPSGEIVIVWDDPEIGIQWPLSDPILSERDRRAATLASQLSRLPRYEP